MGQKAPDWPMQEYLSVEATDTMRAMVTEVYTSPDMVIEIVMAMVTTMAVPTGTQIITAQDPLHPVAKCRLVHQDSLSTLNNVSACQLMALS